MTMPMHTARAQKGSHKISAQKFKFIGALLSVGASVLVSDIDVIYVQVACRLPRPPRPPRPRRLTRTPRTTRT